METALHAVAVAAAVVSAIVIVFFPRPSGIEPAARCVFKDMTVTEIQDEIELTSERRTELWNSLSHGYDPSVAAELKRLSDRLDHLWDEERTLKAALRFGDRDHIVARARVEERLERAA